MTDIFCPLPWIFQAIQNNGSIRVCCQMNVSKDRGTLFKEPNVPYNAAIDSLQEARNTEFIKDVRKSMLEGKWHPSCGRCMDEEGAGLSSKRLQERHKWNYDIEWAKSVTSSDGFIDTNSVKIIYYDLRFGNFCNLSCRMCGPEDSHMWYKDWVALEKTNKFLDTLGEVTLSKNNKGRWTTDYYDWHLNPIFWKNIQENLHNIQYVYMAGGEPLLIERHYDFLEMCVQLGYSNNIILEYNTNLTTISDRALSLWKQFKEVRIGASIDGIGKVLEYQRYPVKSSQIVENLNKIEHSDVPVMAYISCTVTTANVYHIPNFLDWIVSQKFTKIRTKPIISHHVCHKPIPLNIRVLPKYIKENITEYYHNKLSYMKDVYVEKDYNSSLKICTSILKYMNEKDFEQKQYNYFVNWTKDLDKIRGQNIVDVVPQYRKIFMEKDE